MKKIIIGAVLGLAMTASAFAGNVGAGLGYVILGEQSGLVTQLIEITLNGCFCSQGFAVTFGTSGAKQFSGIVLAPTEKFIEENMDFVATDIALGDGEYLDTVASMLEVKDVEGFKAKAKDNFDNIFASADTSAKEVTEKLAELI